MYLKALTLKGFKSFADKTDLNFEPGVTVVVGPNGSGKSNLVDAVAWVLGAQGARALRGAKMDDVIFAGTTKKPALGRAEVSLTIDNSDGTLPIEFSEVSITRTLFRSGESEYRLNDVPCRLLDIQELLSDSRIGRTQHVIVGQGQLDSVLNARPEDRRAIIEEAAGVLKYRKRREKAQRRLEATEGNLTRLSDLVREVRRQLTPLEKQADAARRHDGVRDELNAIKLFLIGQELSKMQSTLERISQERLDQGETEKQLVAMLADLDVQVLDAEAALMKMGDSDVAQWLTRAERIVAKTSATSSMLSERRRSIMMQLEASADESVVESLIAEKSQLENSIAQLGSQLSTLKPMVAKLGDERETISAQYDELLGDAPSDDLIRDLDNTSNELRIHTNNVQVLAAQLEADKNRQVATKQRLSALMQDNQDAKDVVEAETQELEKQAQELEIIARNLIGIKSQIDQIEREYQDSHAASAKAQARHEVLAKTFEENSSQAGIEHVRSMSGVLGTLLEKISIDPRAKDAVEAVFEDLSQTVVIDGKQNAKDVLAQLAEKEINARLLLVQDSEAQQIAAPGNSESLCDFITCSDSKIMNSLRRIFASTVLLNSNWQDAFDFAMEHPELVVVTPAGDRFGGGRNWSLGKSNSTSVTFEQVQDALREAENTKRALQECTIRRDEINQECKALESKERIVSAALSEATSRCEIAKQNFSSTSNAITAREEELALLEQEIASLEPTIEAEQVQIRSLEEKVEELRTQSQNEEQTRQEFEIKKSQLQASLRDIESEYRSSEVESERIGARLNDLKERLGLVEQRLAKDPEQEQAARARRLVLEESLTAIQALMERTSTVESSAVRARDLLSEERQRQTEKAHASTAQLEQLRIQRREAERSLMEVREKIQKGNVSEAETKTRMTTTVETLRGEYEVEPQVAIEAPMPEIDEGTTHIARARELERDLKMMGPINPLAVQEFDELNERHVFLTEQLDDVKASRKELHKVIKTIDEEIVTVFEKAFEDVQKHFSDLFSTLFSGGSGRLTLTDPNDMLNTGIDMEARPSGKNVRRLSLLSGGERSLTALAFLFAVFRSRPSPFYIMDEVEAALDEPNLMRFLDLVAEFRNDAQLLIVSHQKKTMEAADELYGVSMAPGGSSRALKQKVQVVKTDLISAEKELDLVALEAQESANSSENNDDDHKILESSI